MFCKSIIKKPYMFRSLLYDHLQWLSFILSAFTTFPLPASSFAFSLRGRMPSMCMCVRCICLWVVCRTPPTAHSSLFQLFNDSGR
jgi:hypothetical protein